MQLQHLFYFACSDGLSLCENGNNQATESPMHAKYFNMQIKSIRMFKIWEKMQTCVNLAKL